MKALENVRASLSLDVRSMALFRVLIGLLLIADVLSRSRDFSHFYTENGYLPLADYLKYFTSYHWSLHSLIAAGWWPALLFGLQFLSGLLICLGYHTRLMLVIAYVLVISSLNRIWFINTGGYNIFKQMLLISVFLPLSLIDSKNEEGKSHFSVWSVAFIAQAFVVYFFSFLQKSGAAWREDFNALEYAFRLDLYVTDLGFYARYLGAWLRPATIATLILEGIVPFFLFFAWIAGSRWWKVRALAVALFFSFQIALMLVFRLGLFPYFCLVMWVMLIPGECWDWLENRGLSIDRLISRSRKSTKRNFIFPIWAKWPVKLFGLFVLISIFYWNLFNTGRMPEVSLLHRPGRILNLSQQWNTFAPEPDRENFWFVVDGIVSTQQTVNLLRKDGDTNSNRLIDFYQSVENEYWIKLYASLKYFPRFLPLYPAYFCRRWNKVHERSVEGELREVKVSHFERPILLDGSIANPVLKYQQTFQCQ